MKPPAALSFELRTCTDMLEKAKRELKRLQFAESAQGQSVDISDHGMNFAITAWHLSDWVWQNYQGNLHGLGLVKLQKLIRECPELAICYEIATGSKHFTVDRLSPDMRQVKSSTASAVPEATPSFATRVLKIVLANGDRKKATEVFERVVAYWEEFFRKHGIS